MYFQQLDQVITTICVKGLLYKASRLRETSNVRLKYLLTGFKRDEPSTYGSYKTFPSDLKNAQDFTNRSEAEGEQRSS